MRQRRLCPPVPDRSQQPLDAREPCASTVHADRFREASFYCIDISSTDFVVLIIS